MTFPARHNYSCFCFGRQIRAVLCDYETFLLLGAILKTVSKPCLSEKIPCFRANGQTSPARQGERSADAMAFPCFAASLCACAREPLADSTHFRHTGGKTGAGNSRERARVCLGFRSKSLEKIPAFGLGATHRNLPQKPKHAKNAPCNREPFV